MPSLPDITLYQGDCLVEMEKIADGSVDLILCDLPYGTTDRNGVEGKGNNRLLKWDTVIPLDKLWEQYRRILKPLGTVALTADQPFTSQLILSNLEWFKYEWIWKKQKTTGFLLANYRPILLLYPLLNQPLRIVSHILTVARCSCSTTSRENHKT